jgi:deoxyadenosine/deoxycytidine kinase
MKAMKLKARGQVYWVEGLIGAGKTRLTTTLAKVMNLRPMFEPVAANPYLDQFYHNPKRWAFPMQIHLLHHRYVMQLSAMAEAMLSDSPWDGAIMDRGLPGDRVFARLHRDFRNMDQLEWETYELAYETMVCTLRPPSALVFLDVEPEVALYRIQKRNRNVEVGIELDYLRRLRDGYQKLMNEVESGMHAWAQGMRVVRVPWNEDDLPVQPIVSELLSQVPASKFHVTSRASLDS